MEQFINLIAEMSTPSKENIIEDLKRENEILEQALQSFGYLLFKREKKNKDQPSETGELLKTIHELEKINASIAAECKRLREREAELMATEEALNKKLLEPKTCPNGICPRHNFAHNPPPYHWNPQHQRWERKSSETQPTLDCVNKCLYFMPTPYAV